MRRACGIILALLSLLWTAAAAPGAGLPSAADIERASTDSYVLAQFTPLFLDEQSRAYALIMPGPRLRDAASFAFDILEIDQDPSGSLYLYGFQRDPRPKARAAVLLERLPPGSYTLAEFQLHGHGVAIDDSYHTYQTELSFEPDLNRDFVVEPGKVTYVGSFAFNNGLRDFASFSLLTGDPPRLGEESSSPVKVETIDNLPGLLRVLDLGSSGLGKALAPRIVKAAYLNSDEFRNSERKRLQKLLALEAECGNTAALRRLLQDGVDPNIEGEYLYSLANGRRDVAALLVSSGYKVTRFADVVASGDLATLATMLQAEPTLVTSRAKDGDTPLHIACLMGDKVTAEALLTGGAEVNAKNDAGRSALHPAATQNVPGLTRLLVSKGAEVEARDTKGDTPLHLAAADGNLEAVQALLEAGASPGSTGLNGLTPLHGAMHVYGSHKVEPAEISARVAILRALVSHGADINAKDEAGQTPLHVAMKSSVIKLVEEMIANGADVNATNLAGRTPLQEVASNSVQRDLKACRRALRRAGGK